MWGGGPPSGLRSNGYASDQATNKSVVSNATHHTIDQSVNGVPVTFDRLVDKKAPAIYVDVKFSNQWLKGRLDNISYEVFIFETGFTRENLISRKRVPLPQDRIRIREESIQAAGLNVPAGTSPAEFLTGSAAPPAQAATPAAVPASRFELADRFVNSFDPSGTGQLTLANMQRLWQSIEASQYFDDDFEIPESNDFFNDFQRMFESPDMLLPVITAAQFLRNFPINFLQDIAQKQGISLQSQVIGIGGAGAGAGGPSADPGELAAERAKVANAEAAAQQLQMEKGVLEQQISDLQQQTAQLRQQAGSKRKSTLFSQAAAAAMESKTAKQETLLKELTKERDLWRKKEQVARDMLQNKLREQMAATETKMSTLERKIGDMSQQLHIARQGQIGNTGAQRLSDLERRLLTTERERDQYKLQLDEHKNATFQIAQNLVSIHDDDNDGYLTVSNMQQMWQSLESSPLFNEDFEIPESERLFAEFASMAESGPDARIPVDSIADLMAKFPVDFLSSVLKTNHKEIERQLSQTEQEWVACMEQEQKTRSQRDKATEESRRLNKEVDRLQGALTDAELAAGTSTDMARDLEDLKTQNAAQLTQMLTMRETSEQSLREIARLRGQYNGAKAANDALRRTVAGSTSTQSQLAVIGDLQNQLANAQEQVERVAQQSQVKVEKLIIQKANNDAQSLKLMNELQDKLKKAGDPTNNQDLKRLRKEYDALKQRFEKLQDAHTSMFGMDESTQKAAIEQLENEKDQLERDLESYRNGTASGILDSLPFASKVNPDFFREAQSGFRRGLKQPA